MVGKIKQKQSKVTYCSKTRSEPVTRQKEFRFTSLILLLGSDELGDILEKKLVPQTAASQKWFGFRQVFPLQLTPIFPMGCKVLVMI